MNQNKNFSIKPENKDAINQAKAALSTNNEGFNLLNLLTSSQRVTASSFPDGTYLRH